MKNINLKILLLFFILLVMIISHLLYIYTVTSTLTEDPFLFTKKQAIAYFIIILSLLLVEFFIIRRIEKYSNKEKLIKNVIFFLFLISSTIAISLQILPLSYSYEINGVKRWLHLGFFNLAPIELMKITIVYFIANYYTQKENLSKDSIIDKKAVMFYVGVTVLISAVFLKDLGSSVIIFSLLMIFIYLLSEKRKPIFQLIGIGFIGIITLILLFPYRIRRISSWFYSEDGAGYQISQGYFAISEGLRQNLITGSGYLNGVMKQGYIPEVQTDMVLPVLISELGILGYVIYLSLMTICFLSIFIFLKSNKNMISYNLALLFMFTTILSALMNFLGVVGLIPFKGITVPFLSYSGSNTIFNLGMIYLIIKFNKFDNIRNSRELEEKKAHEAMKHAWQRNIKKGKK